MDWEVGEDTCWNPANAVLGSIGHRKKPLKDRTDDGLPDPGEYTPHNFVGLNSVYCPSALILDGLGKLVGVAGGLVNDQGWQSDAPYSGALNDKCVASQAGDVDENDLRGRPCGELDFLVRRSHQGVFEAVKLSNLLKHMVESFGGYDSRLSITISHSAHGSVCESDSLIRASVVEYPAEMLELRSKVLITIFQIGQVRSRVNGHAVHDSSSCLEGPDCFCGAVADCKKGRSGVASQATEC